ncbi:MAG: Unknown protein [uncultured Campylobacterales bacterium]|uniref:Uncharacterized protein n=1 Tax=uncultured Campylobacterales bacterium TaxID=352960 RepID=A0A6S6SJE9_9BACT|nr:MAG: Unknown protein [uncultured Campylobacterales bacterium]
MHFLKKNLEYMSSKKENTSFISYLHERDRFDIQEYEGLCKDIGLIILNHKQKSIFDKALLANLISIQHEISISLIFDKNFLYFFNKNIKISANNFDKYSCTDLSEYLYAYSYLLEQYCVRHMDNIDFLGKLLFNKKGSP